MITRNLIESRWVICKCLNFSLNLFKISNFSVRLDRWWIFGMGSANSPLHNGLIHWRRLTISVCRCWTLDALWEGPIDRWHWVICLSFSWSILTLRHRISRYLWLLIHVLWLTHVLLLLHFVFLWVDIWSLGFGQRYTYRVLQTIQM